MKLKQNTQQYLKLICSHSVTDQLVPKSSYVGYVFIKLLLISTFCRKVRTADILDVVEQSPMMLPSPVTSTPFSVKDILKLEQQSHHLHTHPLQVPLQDLQLQQQRFYTAPSCLLEGEESPGFSDSEDRMAFLNSLSVQDNLVESSLSPPMYAHSALGHVVDAKLEEEIEDQETSK